jgi:DNA-binding CsgD family transcriptional regulator
VAPDAILGREEELAAVAGFFDDDQVRPRALLIEGEAGIGKTTLWREAVRVASADERVLTARASEAEAKLSFTVLADLLRGAGEDVVAGLPPPQRRALRAALLLEDPAEGSRPDARAVSLGVLGALRSLAALGPLTLAVDDIQWVDSPSARALSFALRRLADAPVTVVAAMRVAPDLRDPMDITRTVPGLMRLSIGPLLIPALGRVLRQHLGRRFPRAVVARIHEASGGNPFYAVEIGRVLVRDEIRVTPGEPLPVPGDLHALLRDRLATLPAESREVLLMAACSPLPTLDVVEALGGSEHALEASEHAGIVVRRGPSIEFTHPLLSSAVYADATTGSRRDVHRRLADLVRDPEERARHLALSASGPNEQVAQALDRAALHARARGAPQAGAELCELALEATPTGDVDLRARRAKVQAGNLFDAGDPPRAREILEEAIAVLPPGSSRAEALCLLSECCWKDLGRVAQLLRQALDEVGDDPRLRSWMLADLAWVELDTCELVAAGERARAAVGLAEVVDDDPYLLRLSLAILAIAEFLVGRPAVPLLDRAISLQGTLAPVDLSSPATCLGRLLTWTGELDRARETLGSELARYREQGHETSCYEILAHLADAEYRAGLFGSAAHHLEEAIDVAAEAGVDVLGEILPVRAAVAAATGDADDARRDATDGLAVCDRTGDRWNEIRCRSVLGFLELSLGEHAAAHSWLEPLARATQEMGLREPGVFPFVPDEVEALIVLGDLEHAAGLTDRLEEQGGTLGRSLAIGTAARCRGLIAAALGDLPGAATHLERSLDELQDVPQPFEQARSFLIAGEIERRMKKKKTAREALKAARAIFERFGATIWVARVDRELARIGGRPPSPTALSSTEQQIARLVADGRTNREVADALFVTVRTVEANLTRVYRKLQVRSRTELARKL